MENLFKAFIIGVLILAVVGIVFNTHNNSLVSYPSLISMHSNQSSHNYTISPEDAISIANSNIPAFGEVRYGVLLVNNGTQPYYLVTMYENDPGLNNYGKPIVVSKIDAQNGQFLGAAV
jgi:hypothetical protein